MASKKSSAAETKAALEKSKARRTEIQLFIYLAISVFLMCSNFGWCGVVGNFISKIIFGLFGVVSYLLPIYTFLTAAFFLANGVQKIIVRRVFCAILFLLVIAFICQLVVGADGTTIKELYNMGANDKKGGGVIFGGLIVLLYKLIGLTGSIIVTVLITIIALIIVLDISVVDVVKNNLRFEHMDDDDEEYEEFDFDRPENKDILQKIKVLPDNKKQKKEKTRSKKIDSEEVHELKPVVPKDFFEMSNDNDLSSDSQISNDSQLPSNNQISNDIDEDIQILEPEAPKRRRKKTAESNKEMVEELKAVTESINEKTMAGVDENTQKAYVFPPMNLLKSGTTKSNPNTESNVRATAMKLKSTLENFGVNVTVTNYSCGPSVTRYELQPEQGVKVSKIVNLADDIKLNLAAADIRIEAPIPGKAAIGIEVPNKESTPVFFKNLLESDSFKNAKSKLSFAVGKDISGQVIVADIAKMPHLLVAGATGSGKSVCINTLIMSIIYNADPNDVKMIMIDPKQVELSIYNGIPHLLTQVVTDPKKAAGTLNWAVIEMTNRYQLFAEYNVRNLEGYNAKVKKVTGLEEGNEELKKLPQIVIIVDELADLMMVAHGEVEDAIVRLSQLARAAGIHLVIATQRPSVDVITGLIKANVPSRIAMTVSSGVDSRTIIDMNGAEKLLGKGDMLFYPTGYQKPVRVQGAFLSDEEISKVVKFIKTENGDTKYDTKVSEEINNSNVSVPGSKAGAANELDEYFVDAGKFIIEKEKASIGMLQRVYKIGFNRAARIMDQLSDAGVVGHEEGTKPRKVLMNMEEFENYIEESM